MGLGALHTLDLLDMIDYEAVECLIVFGLDVSEDVRQAPARICVPNSFQTTHGVDDVPDLAWPHVYQDVAAHRISSIESMSDSRRSLVPSSAHRRSTRN